MAFTVNQLNDFFVQTKSSTKKFEDDYVKGTLGVLGGSEELLGFDEFWFEPVFSGKREWRGGFDPKTSEVLTSFGQTGGKIQTTRRKIEENTSGRSVLEQAFMDLKQKYKLKQTKDGFVVGGGVAGVEVDAAKVETTPASEAPRPFPMLAKTLNLSKPPKFPVFTQPKADGVRVLIDFDETRSIRFSSRARNDFTHLKPLFEEEALKIFNAISAYLRVEKEKIVLDGELSIKDQGGADDFQTTISAVKNIKNGLTKSAQDDLKIHLFTFFVTAALPKLTFKDRMHVLKYVHESGGGVSSQNKILFMESREAKSVEELKVRHDEYVAAGSEGLMVYISEGIYEQNKRSSNLLKHKVFNDAEGKIVSVRAGKGRESKAAMVDVEVAKGVVVTMHPKGSIKEREEWLKHPETIVGKMMTYTFQGLTDAGVPRFPVAVAIRDYE